METERSARAVADGVATVFMCAASTARARMLEHASPLVRLLGQRDALHYEVSLLERELEVFRSNRERKPDHQRPHYSPAERARILEVMKLRDWSTKETGTRFVVHPNTIRNWQRVIGDKLRAELLLGGPPWNRLHDGVRWLVHEIRRDWQRGVVEIRTPKSQAAMGWIGHNQESGGIDLGDVTLRIKTSAATVAVTSLDNKPIRESGRLLITAVAQAVPGSEGNQPNAVWIAEPVVGTVEIDLGELGLEEGQTLTLRAIDSTGRAVSMQVIEPDERGVISIPLDGSGLWWLVETN